MKEPKKRTVPVTRSGKKADNSLWEYEYEVYSEAGDVINETAGEQPKVSVGKGFAPHGGIILRNIYNGGYRMAYDIGVIGIYIFPGPRVKSKKPKFLILGPPDFVQVDSNTYKPLDPSTTTDPFISMSNVEGLGYNMSIYNANRESEIKVSYKSNYELFGKGSGYLIVDQKFIFTKYDDRPAHEPSGGLKAARLYPITELYYNTKEGKIKIEDYVASFRVDYRLHINLDTYAKSKTYYSGGTGGAGSTTIYSRSEKNKDRMSNAAGLFRDEDKASDYTTQFTDGLLEGNPGAFIFSASEKPLVAEIITEGLNPNNPVRWDNIHWWGVGKDGILGSTPGSFHAVHIHWRWAKTMQVAHDDKGIDPEFEGYPQFKGQGKNGALTDPAFANQTLRFAVIKNENIPASYHAQKTPVYKDFFVDRRSNRLPKDIEKGDDLILYYSVEIETAKVKKNRYGALSGAIFVHGLFFAHETEISSMFAGSRAPARQSPENPSKTTWERYPEK